MIDMYSWRLYTIEALKVCVASLESLQIFVYISIILIAANYRGKHRPSHLLSGVNKTVQPYSVLGNAMCLFCLP